MQDVLQSQTKELDKANKVGIVCVAISYIVLTLSVLLDRQATWDDWIKLNTACCTRLIGGPGNKSSCN